MKIACVQMDMLPNRAEENFSRAEALVCEASKNQPDVILLPETWNTGFAPDRLDPTQADDDGARTKATFSALAAELGVSRVYLHRVFAKVGTTPSAFLRQARTR